MISHAGRVDSCEGQNLRGSLARKRRQTRFNKTRRTHQLHYSTPVQRVDLDLVCRYATVVADRDMVDDLNRMGKIRHLGVSVENVEEALKSIEDEGVAIVAIAGHQVMHDSRNRAIVPKRMVTGWAEALCPAQ